MKMKATAMMSLAISFALGALFCLHIWVHPYQSDAELTRAVISSKHTMSTGSISSSNVETSRQQLLEVIRVQNETINLLEGVVANKLQMPKLSDLLESNRNKDTQIRDLLSQLQQQKKQRDESPASIIYQQKNDKSFTNVISALTATTSSSPVACTVPTTSTAVSTSTTCETLHHVTHVPLHGLEKECENKYGMQLADLWAARREVWCEDTTTQHEADKSQLICYPYHQEHKKRDGRGPDMFCEATNVFIDFSKVHGDAAVGHKPPLGHQYLEFDKGSLFSPTCARTSKFHGQMFMPHHAGQMASFLAGTTEVGVLPSGSYETESTTTYLLARDEDCENSFHSTADFMNMFLVDSALGIDPKEQKVLYILLDTSADTHPLR